MAMSGNMERKVARGNGVIRTKQDQTFPISEDDQKPLPSMPMFRMTTARPEDGQWSHRSTTEDSPMRLAPTFTATGLCALALTLAACDSGPDVSATNATPEEVQQQVEAAGGDGVMVSPGRWEGQMTVQEIDMPGLPPEAREQMKAQMGSGRSFTSCITEEDVKQQKAFFTGEQDDKSCKYDHFTMENGKVSALLKCDRGEEGRMEMTMNGDYAPDRYRMEMASKAEGGAPMGAMTMKMMVEAKRVGACTGDEEG